MSYGRCDICLMVVVTYVLWSLWHMSYGRCDICMVRCDAQFNGAPCCYKKISQGRVEGHYGETPAIRHIHVKINTGLKIVVTSYTDVTTVKCRAIWFKVQETLGGGSVGRRPLVWWNCGCEWCRGHGGVSVVNVVSCQGTGRSLVQRSPTDCVSLVESGQVQK